GRKFALLHFSSTLMCGLYERRVEKPHDCCVSAFLQMDYHFEYTECDGTGSRWRVAIPRKQDLCTGLPDPVSGTDCTFSCDAGEFLEMSAQQCTPCVAGTYSLGSGIRFDEWDDIPVGFTSLATYLDSSPGVEEIHACKNSSWVPKGSYLESNRDDCTVSLIYAVHLKKQGSVSFEYQYVDNNIFFEFFIQNDQCQEMDQTPDQKWIKLTNNGEWGGHTVNLNSGTNILYWRTTGIFLGTKALKPVLLKNIHIEGVAYTSECFQCKPGTFSRAPGSSTCEPCPRNTHSSKGATSCTPCDKETQYSPEGSAECKEKSACTEKDYFQIHTPCDSDGKTQVIYKWIEPKICLENVTGAVTLPPSGEREPCPPCNPGFYSYNSASCFPCPPGTFSDGCEKCPAGTEPALGYEYKWWNVLPSNMKTSCFNVGNSKCDDMNGWEVAGDHIRSGAGSSDNDYLILNLWVPGFKLPTSVTGSSGTEFGRVTFVFETTCSADCELYFMMDVNRKSTSVVESWEGSKARMSYSHIVTKNASVSFTWAFQRTSQAQDVSVRRLVGDIAKIYSITLTNAQDGTASSCRACALVSQQTGTSCVPCPTGHYIDKDNNRCRQCPPDTYLSGHQVYSKEACIPCGPGSRSNKDRSRCFSDCSFSHTWQNRTLTYDFSPLGPVGSIMNGPSFTSKGTKYFHSFNISLCGLEGNRAAICTDNVTDLSKMERQNEPGEFANYVEAFVCQSTIIPSDGRGFRTALSSQSVSLADTFMGNLMEIHIFECERTSMNICFGFRSSQPTSSCENGRSAVISLRCNPEKTGCVNPGLLLPACFSSKCPAGTCDGCTFNFLWESASACPRCTEADYHEIEGACKGGSQTILYVWNEPKLCSKGVRLPVMRRTPCEAIDFWLKIGAALGAFMALLLISLSCYFWKKNKRLEYKYSRLVMTASRDCDMPAADSCAVMEGDDNEDDVVCSSKPSLLGKLKSMAAKVSRKPP
uniref:Endosome-lysosome associated apoptosis and autophagy regulator family member 2 n=1 Tax=Scleropages formosus TaxID=113540 RepID=A0A8C9U582_SCLFO